MAGLYLAAFALGNILGMTVFAGLMGVVFMRLRESGNRVYQWLLGLTSSAAIALGLFWLGLA
jgi:Na+/H+-dicarboxylate symporter